MYEIFIHMVLTLAPEYHNVAFLEDIHGISLQI
jgi:hypothetical protein